MNRRTDLGPAALALLSGLFACNNSPGDGGAFDAEDSTTGATAADDDGTPTQSTTAASTSAATDALDSTGGSGDPPDIKLDVGGGVDTSFDLCGCAINYIWIANADDSTVSKINTVTVVEEARYVTRADGFGNPSRTSVSFTGDVAVANRHGGLTKFYADVDNCVESNGMPGIQTSSGAADVLAWDMEECRAWSVDFPTTNQRPVAWAPPDDPMAGCDDVVDQVLWTVGSTAPGLAPGTGGPGGVTTWLVDGSNGAIIETVDIPDFPGGQLGAYGGAVDGEGDLYITTQGALTFGVNFLARIEKDTLAVTIWPIPSDVAPYGITVDHNGRPWLSSMFGASGARFDPVTEMFDIIPGTFMSQGGLMEAPTGEMWVATDDGAISFDVETMQFSKVFVVPGGGDLVKGISVDVDGYVWAINNVAYKVDPNTAVEVDSYAGLSSPYTYSDMTGFALQNAFCPPAG
jgi:streptogramin lyase